MVDADYNIWLLEVNSSPSMDYSTQVTERLVKLVLEDTIKVVVDYADAKKSARKNVDTGMWQCVYEQRAIANNFFHERLNLKFELQGRKIKESHLGRI